MSFADFKLMRETLLDDLATILPPVTYAAELFERFKSFDGASPHFSQIVRE